MTPETVLIVDPEAASRQVLVQVLKGSRYRTVAADGFAPAVQLLESTRPDLLITVVRLGLYNGLHLVARGRAVDSRMATLVIDDTPDPALEQEATRVGATAYLAGPLGAGELLKHVTGALATRERRRFSRTSATSNVVVRIGTRRAKLLDVSDSGFRLESGWLLPAAFRLELPATRSAVTVQRIWSRRADGATTWWSGAALILTDGEGRRRWQQLVDTLRNQGTACLDTCPQGPTHALPPD